MKIYTEVNWQWDDILKKYIEISSNSFEYGGDLNNFLFENLDDLDQDELTDTISLAINNYEPRAQFINVKASIMPDYNSLDITVKFQILNTLEYDEINLQLTRLR